jgi:norsolorinic acid ketoreductase
VFLDANSATSATQAAAEIQIKHRIDHIDVVIANAGICSCWGPVLDVHERDMYAHFEVNTMGPLRLFQSMAPLLQKARIPKFVYISTQLASIGGIGQTPTLTVAYGISKAAGNYLVRKIHAENEHLIALSFDPG